jgi:hypothetical protein
VMAWVRNAAKAATSTPNRHRGAADPDRHPVPSGPHAEQDRGDHQQEADDRRARRVVGAPCVNSHRGNGQAEGDEGGCLYGVRHNGWHVLALLTPWKRGRAPRPGVETLHDKTL